MHPTVPEGHKHGVTTPEKPSENPADPRRTPQSATEPSERPPQSPLRELRRALWEANFLRESRGGLCPSDGDPPELEKCNLQLLQKTNSAFWRRKDYITIRKQILMLSGNQFVNAAARMVSETKIPFKTSIKPTSRGYFIFWDHFLPREVIYIK